MGALKIEGIIFRSEDFEESAKLLQVFSKQYGLLNIYAPGVNKEASKNKYSVQTLSLSEFEIFKARSETKFSKLKTGNLINNFGQISKNYQNYIYMSVLVNVLSQLLEYGQKKNLIYNAFKTVIININNNHQAFINYVMFLLYYVQNSEYKMRLDRCSRCKKNDQKMVRFEYSDKTLICKRCLWPEETIQTESFVDIFYIQSKLGFLKMLEFNYHFDDLIALHIFLIDYLNNDLGVFIVNLDYLKKSALMKLNDNKMLKYK
ncbi:DNA repair protein RecO [Spiroplasma culicicola]|uniref:DNA repair protein RecO n=1 Tax=Spiroplasma culicicola AES-1 TaxID=1276246 RepID=W6A7V3_9MOLU|nr:DNA repair protein RecO [Spiroplasma culicicola]AHI53071.1 DNA repair protein recO [Spiroplasma culicicola AES-1]